MAEGDVYLDRSGHSHVCLAAATTGAGTELKVPENRTAVISLASDGGADADMTVKVQGTIQEETVAWGSAQTVTNMWDYIEVIDLEDGTAIDGDTGITWGDADDYRLVEVNTNGLYKINLIVSGRTAGEVTGKIKLFKNS